MEEFELGRFLALGGLALFLIAANAFFVAAEFALVASRRTRIQELAEAGHKRAKLALTTVKSLDRYISATQLGITAASLGLGWIGEPALAGTIEHAFGGLPSPFSQILTHTVAGTTAFLIITFLHIVLGELAPKTLALVHPEETSMWLAGPLIGFAKATNPFIWVLNGTANALLRLFGTRPLSEAERVHRPEEILMLARQSKESGELDEEDMRLIEGVFEFSEKNLRDVMTPRTDVVALPLDISIEQAAQRVTEAMRSRYPVYRESLDDIVGVVHVKQIFGALLHEDSGSVSSLMREPLFLPGTREVEDALADMRRLRVHIAVVIDEYGGTAGIVTMEDLLEEIVGEVYDEYDEGTAPITAVTGGVIVPGDAEIEDLDKQFGMLASDQQYQTVGGLVFGHLGRLPRPGDRIQLDDLTITVLKMDRQRVAEVRLTRKGDVDSP